MGKTNLLFNAKRRLENERRLFAYVDLSNTFKYERDCYRNIIDNIIEPNDSCFESVVSDIETIRDKNLPPHKEYSNSLRILLNHFDGDLVIVLDEIDALRSADYSDNIFAQIRSNYFSRTNFPEFERLTYILSGVIEPSELIKDRNKSPFNIGDKIYLDDFTRNEHDSFAQKTGLKISEDVSSHIFDWTNGNPRLTFDIFSELESLIIQGSDIDTNAIDDIIHKKYLTSFDVAPIDHIRELVKGDKRVRRAVLEIQTKKKFDLSDDIKRRLYLFGIIDSNFDKETSIKNKIISKSLTKEWIKSIDKQTQDDYNLGLELMDQLEFREAIETLSDFLANSNPTPVQIEVCNYNLGFAYNKLQNFEAAEKFFSKEYSEPLYKRNSKSLLGICKLGLGKTEEGRQILEEIIDTPVSDFSYRNAILNLAPIIASEDAERALVLYDSLFNSTLEGDRETPEEELAQIRTLSKYYKAEIYHDRGDTESTIKSLQEALEHSSASDSLFIRYSIYRLVEPKDVEFKATLVNTIINDSLKFDTANSYPISFSENHLYTYLNLVFDESNLELFDRLVDYAESTLYNTKVKREYIVYTASISSSEKGGILNYILKNHENLDSTLLVKIYGDLCFAYSEDSIAFSKNFLEYRKLFLQQNAVGSTDVYLYALAVRNESNFKNYHEAIRLCSEIDTCLSNQEMGEELKVESVIIYYWYANLGFSIRDYQMAVRYANKTIDLITALKLKRTSIIDEKGLKSIIEQMQQIIVSSFTRQPIVNAKKYGRNDRVKVRYLDGKVVEDKYKRLEADILADRCTIVH
jgi:tetratricopeptide (TPR) repeat protein